MSAHVLTRATLDDLHAVEGKAELVGGRIVHFMATGVRPGLISVGIYNAIKSYSEATRRGFALPDNVGFAVPELVSGRESFSPDAAYYLGTLPRNDMDFAPGPPAFAVEVRSKGDYGPAAEEEMAAKRADYFEAGTEVVWDVDPQAEIVRVYRRLFPERPVTFGVGESADAEPVMPGWRLAADIIFTR